MFDKGHGEERGMKEQAPLQVYHEIIERIGEAMADSGVAEITVGNVKISRIPYENESKGLPWTGELWDADPDCDHEVVNAPGGGVKCNKCPGWFCF